MTGAARPAPRRAPALLLWALVGCSGGGLESGPGAPPDLGPDLPDLGSGLPGHELPAYQPFAPCRTLVSSGAETGSAGSRALAFSPDGRVLLAGGARAQLFAVQGGELRAVLEGVTGAVAFAPDGSRLVAARAGQPGLSLFDVGSLRLVGTVQAPPTPVRALAVAPDGARVAAATDGGIALVRLSGAVVERTVPLVDQVPMGLALSDDGAWLGSVAADRGVYLQQLAEGAPPRRVAGAARSTAAVAFLPGSRRVATAVAFDHAARLFQLADWSEEPPLPAATGSVRSVAVTADGALAAVGDGVGQVIVIRLADRARLQIIDTGDGPGESGVFALALSRDGRTLAAVARGGLIRLFCATP